MPYPEEVKTFIRKVEDTRPARIEKRKLGEEFPFMSPEERDDILKYHPDYNEEGRRELRVGMSKGYRIPHEFADLLEAKSRVDPDAMDLSAIDYETDVLVIGGGGAGTAAALLAQEQLIKGRAPLEPRVRGSTPWSPVVLITKLRHGDANTMMAEGGIQAASKAWKDSPYYHYLDVLGGGHFKNDPDLVYTLVNQAPEVLIWLEGLGVCFSKGADGTLQSMHGAGTSRKRMHYCADITGTEIMRTLRDEARNRAQDIRVIEFTAAVELLLNEHGHCAGALIYNMETEEYSLIKARAVVMATGGAGRLHIQGFPTTNHYGATADGIVLGYRAGVKIAFLHTVQYHPTCAIFPEQMEGLLITERFRGAGADVLNVDGEKFVNEREPRDVESAAFIRECLIAGSRQRVACSPPLPPTRYALHARGKGVPTPTGKLGIWVDSPMIDILYGEGTVRRDFVGKWKAYERQGIDISKEPMLVYPGLHYQNGGLVYNPDCETVVPGLFAAGEVTGGVHGENRLMGNSLLDVHLFGRIAGKNAALYAREKARDGTLTLEHVRDYHRELEKAGIETGRTAPILLPDYTDARVRARQLTTHRVGTLR